MKQLLPLRAVSGIRRRGGLSRLCAGGSRMSMARMPTNASLRDHKWEVQLLSDSGILHIESVLGETNTLNSECTLPSMECATCILKHCCELRGT